MAATRWKGSTEQRNLRQFQTSLHNKSGIKIIFCAKQCGRMARRLHRIPDYFSEEAAGAGRHRALLPKSHGLLVELYLVRARI